MRTGLEDRLRDVAVPKADRDVRPLRDTRARAVRRRSRVLSPHAGASSRRSPGSPRSRRPRPFSPVLVLADLLSQLHFSASASRLLGRPGSSGQGHVRQPEPLRRHRDLPVSLTPPPWRRRSSTVHCHFSNHPAAAGFAIHRLTGIPKLHGAGIRSPRRPACS